MKCPECKGNGSLFGMSLRSGFAGHIACPACGGIGEVSRDQLWAMQVGDRMRQTRIGKGFGLRQAAELLGILPSDLAAMEHGRITPKPELIDSL